MREYYRNQPSLCDPLRPLLKQVAAAARTAGIALHATDADTLMDALMQPPSTSPQSASGSVLPAYSYSTGAVPKP